MKKIKPAGAEAPDVLLPPEGYYDSTLDWVGHSGLKKETILFEIYPPIPIPKVMSEEESLLLRNKPKCSNKGFVVRMPYGRVWGERAVISPDNKLLWDVSVEWAPWLPEKHSIFQAKELSPLEMYVDTEQLIKNLV